VVSQIWNIAAIHQLRYYELSSLPFCNRRPLFIDHYHMNHSGATLFTRYFSGIFNNKIAGKPLK
jgi:hypothetical protein